MVAVTDHLENKTDQESARRLEELYRTGRLLVSDERLPEGDHPAVEEALSRSGLIIRDERAELSSRRAPGVDVQEINLADVIAPELLKGSSRELAPRIAQAIDDALNASGEFANRFSEADLVSLLTTGGQQVRLSDLMPQTEAAARHFEADIDQPVVNNPHSRFGRFVAAVKRPVGVLFLAAVASILPACGGGGSGSHTNTDPAPIDNPDTGQDPTLLDLNFQDAYVRISVLPVGHPENNDPYGNAYDEPSIQIELRGRSNDGPDENFRRAAERAGRSTSYQTDPVLSNGTQAGSYNLFADAEGNHDPQKALPYISRYESKMTIPKSVWEEAYLEFLGEGNESLANEEFFQPNNISVIWRETVDIDYGANVAPVDIYADAQFQLPVPGIDGEITPLDEGWEQAYLLWYRNGFGSEYNQTDSPSDDIFVDVDGIPDQLGE